MDGGGLAHAMGNNRPTARKQQILDALAGVPFVDVQAVPRALTATEFVDTAARVHTRRFAEFLMSAHDDVKRLSHWPCYDFCAEKALEGDRRALDLDALVPASIAPRDVVSMPGHSVLSRVTFFAQDRLVTAISRAFYILLPLPCAGSLPCTASRPEMCDSTPLLQSLRPALSWTADAAECTRSRRSPDTTQDPKALAGSAIATTPLLLPPVWPTDWAAASRWLTWTITLAMERWPYSTATPLCSWLRCTWTRSSTTQRAVALVSACPQCVACGVLTLAFSADQVGEGAGKGETLCIPLPPGCDWARYSAALATALSEAAKRSPVALVVSLGLDTLIDDPEITPGARRGAVVGCLVTLDARRGHETAS